MGIMRIEKTTPPPHPNPLTQMLHMWDQNVSLCWSRLYRDRHLVDIVFKSQYKKTILFPSSLKKSTHGLSIFCHEHFIPQDQNIAYLYFVAHISHNFSSENLLFSPKVTPRWHFGSSHHHLVENVVIFIVGLKVCY